MRIVIEKSPKKRKKREFSKIWLAVCITVSVIFTGLSYLLAFLDKQPLESLSGTIIETLWGASGVSFCGYALQNGVRAFTASKFGIPKAKTDDKTDDEEAQG